MKRISRHGRLVVPAIAGVAAIGLVLSGCTASKQGSSATSASLYSDVSITFVSGPLNDSFFPPLFKGANQAAKDLGIKFKYIPMDEANFEQSSVTSMETAIAGHPSAIVVGDFIPGATDPEIKKAIAAGIPVYIDQSGESSWKSDGAFGYVGQDPTNTGTVAGQQLVKNGAKHILCVVNVPGNPYLQSICSAVEAGVNPLGATSTLLNLPTADSTDPTKVTADIGAFLKSHPETDGIFTLNGAVGTYAIDAAKSAAAGRTIHIGSLELSKVGLADVQSGSEDFVISEQPYLDGYFGVLYATQYVKFGLSPVGQVFTGPLVIDKSNIASTLKVTAKYPDVLGSN